MVTDDNGAPPHRRTTRSATRRIVEWIIAVASYEMLLFVVAAAADSSDSEEGIGRQIRLRSGQSYSIWTTHRSHFNSILAKAAQKGLGGGLPGAAAGFIQVLGLMWLRTVVNYQCRYGTSFAVSLGTLYREGGIGRFYRGLGFALIQAPVVRFVSTAANEGAKSLLANLESTKEWGPTRTTMVASIIVGLWRMLLMPLDTAKTVLQVDSTIGYKNLVQRVKAGNIGALYQGSLANAVSSVLGNYPWFFIYNVLSNNAWVEALVPSSILRNAGIGLAASVVSDTVVNCIKVVKTAKQSLGPKRNASYGDVINMIVATDGWIGLFGRGLKARILANALQSVVFTVIWRSLAERWSHQ